MAAGSFTRIRLVTQAEAWAQALPGPVTQFPQLCRDIIQQKVLLLSLAEALRHAWYVSVCEGPSYYRLSSTYYALRALHMGFQSIPN